MLRQTTDSRCYGFAHLVTKERAVVPPFSTHCNQWEAGVIPIARDTTHAGHVLIRYTDMATEDFTAKTKSVPLQ